MVMGKEKGKEGKKKEREGEEEEYLMLYGPTNLITLCI